MRPRATLLKAFLFLALAASAVPARAQQILLEPVRAGQLTLFRDLNDDKDYYYVSDKPHLALDADGQPQFSVLRWVENVRTGAGEPEAREGEGGGIAHALVTLAVTSEQIQEAQSELQRQRPGGRIRGPVMFKGGSFGLVSSFKDPAGGLVTQVVGVGKPAPLLDTGSAAVSLLLTKRGAQILWESLKTPTPDISFSFEMQMEGFRPPARAILEADFDQIYSHKSFAAGIATTHLGAEIETAFDDLRRTGAIKLTEIGDNADLHALISTAYTRISQIMFDTAPDILKPAAGLGPGQLGTNDSMLDKASRFLAASRADADKRATDGKKKDDSAALAEARTAAQNADQQLQSAEAEVTRLEGEVKAAKRAAETPAQPAAPKPEAPKPEAAKPEAPKPEAPKPEAPKPEAPKPEAAKPDTGKLAQKEDELKQAREKRDRLRQNADKAKARVSELEAASKDSGDKKDDRPGWAAIASFKMKEIRQRGKMKWDLNKYTESQITLRFDGNIGDVRKFKDHFREVNLWSPLYQQREVVVYVDGASAGDFGKYVNFVTVRLHKRHAGGDVTDDEVLIDRNNFNKEGNRFKLLYGWKGDNDRGRWMEYEYQTVWSLFGGKTVELPMQKSTAQAIPVVPPYERRSVELRADADQLAKADVRSVNVKLFYDLGAGPQVKQATLDAAKPQSAQIEFMSLPGSVDYEYEVTWRLKGNRTVSSGRQKASDAWIDVSDVGPSQ